MPPGWLKRASLPVPSLDPDGPARPARVVTTPLMIIRTVLLPLSATYSAPQFGIENPHDDELATATARGELNRAALPVPSALPGSPAEPATVLTTPGVVPEWNPA